MKILRYIFAIPIGILGGVVVEIITRMLSPILLFFAKLVSYDFEMDKWMPSLVGCASVVMFTTFIAPSYKKIFSIISMSIIVCSFIYNILIFNEYWFSVLLGAGIGGYESFKYIEETENKEK